MVHASMLPWPRNLDSNVSGIRVGDSAGAAATSAAVNCSLFQTRSGGCCQRGLPDSLPCNLPFQTCGIVLRQIALIPRSSLTQPRMPHPQWAPQPIYEIPRPRP